MIINFYTGKSVENRSLLIIIFCVLQYYEMSYGLNIEMHKQVNTKPF